MKKFFSLLFLALLLGGSYFAYTHKKQLKKFAKDVQQGIDESREEERNQNKPRKPKILKPDAFAALDSFARNAPARYATNFKTLAHYLIQPAHNDREKARVLFTWVATHIRYDDEGYNKKQYGSGTAESTLQSGRSVCEGYGNLLERLCSAAGLEAVSISGYSKGYSYTVGDTLKEEDHKWNAIKYDGRWHLFDVTWAAGYGETVDGKMKAIARFDPYWFDVDPKAFIFCHLPADSKWQLNSEIVTKQQFQAMPWLRDDFFKLGFDPQPIFAAAIAGDTTSYVQTYQLTYPLKVSKAPYTRVIAGGQDISYIIESDYAEKIALVDGDDWTFFEKNGNRFTLKHAAEADSVSIVMKTNWYEKNYDTAMKYMVVQKPVAVARAN